MNEERILKAYEFAKKAHEESDHPFRESGEPYIQHPLETAKILLDLKPDEDALIAAILHDVLEDTRTTVDDIQKELGDRIVPLLKGLEKLGKIYYQGRERQVENLRKMFLAMAKDIRVILIKLCDRLHNMRTLDHIKPEKRKRIAEETLSIYSPIAARLGIYRIKNELDDLCFKYIQPVEFERIHKEMEDATGLQKNIIKKGTVILKTVLKKNKIPAEIEGRVKHYYSIFRKLKRKDKNYISELYDIFALRIIVNTEAECYQVLGIIHKNWTPLTRRFKDYIANKKSNDYQSLHTTIVGLVPNLNNQPVEIQIRTHDMNHVAKYGIAAHWEYKERKGGYSIAVPEDKLNWVQNLVALHESLKSNSEFIENLNMDMFHDRIFVVTPKGDVKDLPRDATPVDFAYAIHTDIGNKCRGAKVDGKIVPLDYKLQNNQVVEIVTGNTPAPNRYWLSFAVTAHAKSSIKQWFNTQEKENLVKLGKDLLNKHLKRLGLSPLSSDLGLLKNYSGEKLTVREREEVLEKIGNGSVEAISIIKKILPKEKLIGHEAAPKVTEKVLAENVKLEKNDEILITGQKGYKTQLATCCHPTVENEIIGYVTRGRGVTIHRIDCKVLQGHEKNRFVRASWGMKSKPTFEVRLSIEKKSRIGLLRDIAEIFTRLNLSITSLNIGPTLTIDTIVDNVETLDRLINELETVPDVYKVKETPM
ncbi:bifunctional (p)ppGpp synthetase/guanosine-3',5'-bis(diphosphate) 3'-pyrophosphohydrolase [Patescibacteria group bacterium]|nr:bifunctional (p)ppGpp synthetase/guanosine-3',5'-bis(diphosphate) 3'-pyrophosphohydrolase [Patescibacteria group bacterium]MBU1015928.1 bifunctional (p)ppGpp synthetase/guanosine-3',5'-bis(diphosphate) 3'-pyrophosphohydrolase [Patescibacteria group bacterium]MBU1685097.1 bifunctional (p)ppGpp synthetase/guanosine-3',5'-bis(diphosphate) 3'-pyrophosphohydrolase [Patescibacteria group bacterium]MBU1938191.1 bifunctional (p)ppGpp synthetase/guanosine-3',5'-bis(diphosphate) 3'-pyrophosphohydrolase